MKTTHLSDSKNTWLFKNSHAYLVRTNECWCRSAVHIFVVQSYCNSLNTQRINSMYSYPDQISRKLLRVAHTSHLHVHACGSTIQACKVHVICLAKQSLPVPELHIRTTGKHITGVTIGCSLCTTDHTAPSCMVVIGLTILSRHPSLFILLFAVLRQCVNGLQGVDSRPYNTRCLRASR